MKQTTKRFYGTLAVIAVVSGLTGAFAFSLVNRLQRSGTADNETEGESSWLTTSSAQPLQASYDEGGRVDLTYAAEKACNAVVYIKVTMGGEIETREFYDPFEDFFGDFFGGRGNGGRQRQQVQTPKRQASGSGVIISEDGYIVTNNHVVEKANEITITLNDNREFTARVIGLDATTDLALLKIDAEDLPTLVVGDSEALKVGEWVLAVGNPFNLTSTVTAGIVSAKARQLGASQNGIESFIQTDAAINAGNSGGALVNARGELVGINAMLYSQTGNFTGYGFAIPTTIMNKVVADLKVYGTVQRALLGVSGSDVTNYIDNEKANGNEVDLGTVKGVYIAEVSSASAAEDAGLMKGDVVTDFEGKSVNKMSELQEAIAQHRPGDKVTITYIRDKKKQKVEVTLRNAQGGTKVMEEVDIDQLGVQMKPLPDEIRKSLGIDYGLIVNAIRKGKLQNEGVNKGTIFLQVNDQKLSTVEDWEEAVKNANQSSERTLWIKALTPSGRKASFVIDLNEK